MQRLLKVHGTEKHPTYEVAVIDGTVPTQGWVNEARMSLIFLFAFFVALFVTTSFREFSWLDCRIPGFFSELLVITFKNNILT